LDFRHPAATASDSLQNQRSWETRSELPRFSVALHGAAELLGVMLQEGVKRQEVDAALGRLLDDIEQRISEDQVLGGPPRGSA